MAVKVFIVDDHYMVIEGLRSLLQNGPDIEWLGHATTATSCMAFLRQQPPPDVILMDINLPDKSGIDLCSEVRKNFPGVFVIGLSTFNQQSFINKMLENGASGYLLKNATQNELVQAIAEVAKGRQYVSFEVSQTLRKNQELAVVLTRREKEVLVLIAEGLTNQDIASKLFVGITTVDTHRKNLLAKFGTPNVAALVKKAMDMGML